MKMKYKKPREVICPPKAINDGFWGENEEEDF